MNEAATFRIADERADEIIRGMIAQIAAMAIIPAAVNWAFIAALMSVGAMRIGRAYGYRFNKDEGWQLIRQLFKAAGLTFLGLSVGAKMFTAIFQATGIGYLPAVAMDVAVSAAIAYAVGMGAKHYFRHDRSMTGVGGVVREAFKEARYKFSTNALASLRERQQVKPYNPRTLARILSGKSGRDALRYALVGHPETLNLLTDFLKRHGPLQLHELTREHLEAMDAESGLAHEIWDLLQDEYDVSVLEKKGRKLKPKSPAQFKKKVAAALSPVLLGLKASYAYSAETASVSTQALTDSMKTMPPAQLHSAMEPVRHVFGDGTNPFLAVGSVQPDQLFLADLTRVASEAQASGLLDETLHAVIQVSLDFDPAWTELVPDSLGMGVADALLEALA